MQPMPDLETLNPDCAPPLLGPYSPMVRVGSMIWGSAIAGVDPQTGELAGPDVFNQAAQIIKNVSAMLETANSGLDHVVSVNVFLKQVDDFEGLNAAYRAGFRGHAPTRSVVVVSDLPKSGAVLTMNYVAVTKD